MAELGLHLRKLPEGVKEACDQLLFGQGGLKHDGFA
jgi:hypothetical protein